MFVVAYTELTFTCARRRILTRDLNVFTDILREARTMYEATRQHSISIYCADACVAAINALAFCPLTIFFIMQIA